MNPAARLGLALARVGSDWLPPRWLHALGRLSAPLMYHGIPVLRRSLQANARYLLGPTANTADRRRQSISVLANFARFTIELLTAHRAPPVDDGLFERMTGRAHYDAARAAGKGIIGVTLHLGNYEAGPMLLTRLHQPVSIVYNRDPSGIFERARSKRRSEHAIGEIAIDGSPFFGVEALAVLRRQGMLLVAADVGFGAGRGEAFPFLGGQAPFLTWPARLSRASGAPLLPCFIVRDHTGQYQLEIAPPVFPDEPEQMMAQLLPVFEDLLRRYPEQWLIIHRYWHGNGR